MFLLAVDARSDDALGLVDATFARRGDTVGVGGPSVTLLPTPTKSMTTGPGAGGREGGLNLQTAVMLMPEARDGLMELLPTPTANHGDARRGSPSPEVGRRRIASGRRMLEDAVAAYLTYVEPVAGELLPTPTASQYGTNVGGAAGRVGQVRQSLNTMAGRGVIAPDKWGPYAAAIKRWADTFGYLPPSPTMTSPRTGKPQLAPAFVEWMQGFEPGYVDDVPGLGSTPAGERNGKLSLLGDAVVPQQGAYAYSLLLGDLHHTLFGTTRGIA